MRISPGYSRTCTGCEPLRKQVKKLVRVDEFEQGVRAGLDDTEELFRR